MTTVRLPQTVEEAVSSLEGIESLLRAKGWERAAIVAAFVRLGEGSGERTDLGPRRGTPPRFLSSRGFADLGITGLSDHETVSFYVQRWLDEHGPDSYPEPGSDVALPEKEWPPGSTRGTDGYNSPAGVAKTVAKIADRDGGLDELAEAVAADPHVAAKIMTRTIQTAPRVVVEEAMAPLDEEDRIRFQLHVATADLPPSGDSEVEETRRQIRRQQKEREVRMTALAQAKLWHSACHAMEKLVESFQYRRPQEGDLGPMAFRRMADLWGAILLAESGGVTDESLAELLDDPRSK